MTSMTKQERTGKSVHVIVKVSHPVDMLERGTSANHIGCVLKRRIVFPTVFLTSSGPHTFAILNHEALNAGFLSSIKLLQGLALLCLSPVISDAHVRQFGYIDEDEADVVREKAGVRFQARYVSSAQSQGTEGVALVVEQEELPQILARKEFLTT